MSDLNLILINSFVFLVGFLFALKKDIFFAIYFLLLYIYSIFSQIGYFFFPYLSEQIFALFSIEAWRASSILILKSALLLYFLFFLLWSKSSKLIKRHIIIKNSKKSITTVTIFFIYFLCYVYCLFYFVINFENISWFSAQLVEKNHSIGYFLFLLLFKIQVGLLFSIYAAFRFKQSIESKKILFIIFCICLLAFIIMAWKLGNRTDFSALALGISIFELSRSKIRITKIFKIFIFLIIIFFSAEMIEKSRYGEFSNVTEQNIIDKIFLKDYYAPCHMLFAAVEYRFQEPTIVTISNFKNSLVFFDYPFLQYFITELFREGVTSRAASYGFYIFTEGYMLFGKYGYIYNAFIIFSGLVFWRNLSNTKNPAFNNYMIGLTGCMLINLVRGQSCYFFKYIYLFILPSLLFYCSLTSTKIKLCSNTKNKHEI